MFSVLKWFGTYSAIHQAARLPAAEKKWSAESIPVSGTHSQPMEIFPSQRNCTSQSHGTTWSCKASKLVNNAVTISQAAGNQNDL